MRHPLTHTFATYTDIYQTDVVLTPVGDHPPIRATEVQVTLDHVPDGGPRRDVRVRVRVTGEKIIEDGHGGYTTANQPTVEAFGLGLSETRYTLCQDAVRATLERRDLTEEATAGFAFLEPYDVHKQRVELGSANLAGSVSHHLHYVGDQPDQEDERW